MARKMKDSGIEWIGMIPEGWEAVPVKRLCTMQAGKNLTSEQIAPEGTYPVYGGNGIRGFFSDYNCDGQFLTVGRQGALCGNVHKINGKVWATEHAVITTPSGYTNLDFLYYLLIGMDLNQYVSSTAAQPGLAVGTLLNLKTCYPCSTLEQTQISNYLNAKCSEIDVMLSKTRSSIEEYKKLKQTVITQTVTKGVRGEREMKDSGVEWIGEIPTTYSICKLKYLLKNPLKYGANESGIPYSDSLPRYIRITDITPDGNLKYTGKLSLSEESAKDYILEDGDILFARSGATVGKTFIYYQSYGRSAYAGYLIKASLNNKVSPKFVYYYTCSSLYEIWKNSIFIQSTIQNIGADRYANLPVPVPKTLQEQEEIADYLDAKCAEIDKLIAKKEQLVKELENYKKSLIYEVVTGKREV